MNLSIILISLPLYLALSHSAILHTKSLEVVLPDERHISKPNLENLAAQIDHIKNSLLSLSALRLNPTLKKEIDKALLNIDTAESLAQNNRPEEAKTHVKIASNTYATLNKKIMTIYQTAMGQGHNALKAGKVSTAKKAFSHALKFTDAQEEANQGLALTKKLATTLAFVEQGDSAKKQGNIEAALRAYESAIALSPNSNHIQAKLTNLQQLNKDNRFRKHMEQGNSYLLEERYQLAIQEFQNALDIDNDSVNALTALRNAENSSRTATILHHLGHALAAEQQEHWQKAITHFDHVLELDPDLERARLGKLNALRHLAP